MLKASRKIGYKSHAGKPEGIGHRASRHADQYGQSGLGILGSRTLKESGRIVCTSKRDKTEGIRRSAS